MFFQHIDVAGGRIDVQPFTAIPTSTATMTLEMRESRLGPNTKHVEENEIELQALMVIVWISIERVVTFQSLEEFNTAECTTIAFK